MVRARLRGAIHWVNAVSPGPFTAARKRRRERLVLSCLAGQKKRFRAKRAEYPYTRPSLL
jgi:hypothetical protein